MLADYLTGMVMAKMSLTYGRRFTGGYDAPPQTVRDHWAHELAGISEEGILYALQRLPADYCPNVLQFRLIASGRPENTDRRLPAPQASPTVQREHLQALQALREAFLKGKKHVDIAWAKRIAANPQQYSYYARKLSADVIKARGHTE